MMTSMLRHQARLAALLALVATALATTGPAAAAQDTSTWTFTSTSLVPQAGAAAAAGGDGLIYQIGGCHYNTYGKCVFRPSMQIYRPTTDHWARGPKPPFTPGPYAHAVTGSDGRIYLLGSAGQTAVYSPSERHWDAFAAPPTPRYASSAAAADDGTLYVVGGYTSGPGWTTDLEAHDASTGAWHTLAPEPRALQYTSSVVGTTGLLYVFGLHDAGVTDVDVYDPSTDSWSEGPPIPGAWHAPAVVRASDGYVYVANGYTPQRLDGNTWQPAPSFPGYFVPSAMVAWGSSIFGLGLGSHSPAPAIRLDL